MSDMGTGGPAFPVATSDSSAPVQVGNFTWQFPGLTLRDYFAGRAMEALIQTLANTDQADDEMRRLGLGEGEYDKLVAKCAFDYADEMLKARMK